MKIFRMSSQIRVKGRGKEEIKRFHGGRRKRLLSVLNIDPVKTGVRHFSIIRNTQKMSDSGIGNNSCEIFGLTL